MSVLRALLARNDSGLAQFLLAAGYYGGQETTRAALSCWCDLRRRGDAGETMADLLASGAVSEGDVRACFVAGAA